MATYIPKNRGDVLRNALQKIERDTPIKTTSLGSVARSFTEAITSELADMYDVLDYNISQSTISSATGRHLDAIGELYNVTRSTVQNNIEISRSAGAFYFSVDSPVTVQEVIPAGTRVYTSAANFIGRQLTYVTTTDAIIPVGETRVFASIRPDFGNNEVTAGAGTLIVHDYRSPNGVLVNAYNPKPIFGQKNYESDDNYRARIIKRIAVQATGTPDALKFALLGSINVRDVRVENNRLGLGIAEVMVVPQDTGFTVAQINSMRDTLNRVKPSGVRVIINTPEVLEASLTAILFLDNTRLVSGEADSISARALSAVRSYINSLLPGERLVYNRMIDIALGVSDKVIDVSITRFSVGGSSSIRGNFTPTQSQMIVPGIMNVTSGSFS